MWPTGGAFHRFHQIASSLPLSWRSPTLTHQTMSARGSGSSRCSWSVDAKLTCPGCPRITGMSILRPSCTSDGVTARSPCAFLRIRPPRRAWIRSPGDLTGDPATTRRCPMGQSTCLIRAEVLPDETQPPSELAIVPLALGPMPTIPWSVCNQCTCGRPLTISRVRTEPTADHKPRPWRSGIKLFRARVSTPRSRTMSFPAPRRDSRSGPARPGRRRRRHPHSKSAMWPGTQDDGRLGNSVASPHGNR